MKKAHQETTLLREPNGNGYHRSKEAFPMPLIRHLSQMYTPRTTFFRLLPADHQESPLTLCQYLLSVPRAIPVLWRSCQRVRKVSDGGRDEEAFFLFPSAEQFWAHNSIWKLHLLVT